METHLLARELNFEEKARRSFPVEPVSIQVADAQGVPVVGAEVTVFHEETGFLETHRTGAGGFWRGPLLPGPWIFVATKVFPPPPVDPTSTDIPPTRMMYVISQEVVEGPSEFVMLPGPVATPLRFENEEGVPLDFDRMWLAPKVFADPLRYADVARRSRDAFVLDVKQALSSSGVSLEASPEVIYEIAAYREPGVIPGAMLMTRTLCGAEPVSLTLDPGKLALIEWSSAEALGGTDQLDVTVSLPQAIRTTHSITVRGRRAMYVPPGLVRTTLSYETETEESIAFAPHQVTVGPGQRLDLTPKAPLGFQPCMVRSGDDLQIWLAIHDRLGRVIMDLGARGLAKAAYRGRLLFEKDIAGLRFQFPAGMDDVDIDAVIFAAKVEIGGKEYKWQAPATERERFQGDQAEVVAPKILESHARPYLEISRKSLVGSKKVMGLAKNLQRISNIFEVFLPPDVGGLGGGGRIMLDLRDLIRFASTTDPLPGAYRHEFGHNLGFGHDPYMFIATSGIGIDEELFGHLGFRMMQGRSIARTLRYLDRERPDPATPWEPNGDVFATIGLLRGQDLHEKMFAQRKAYGRVLNEMGLSVIERIATQYSYAAKENLAWIFRAFGWPVLDERVMMGFLAIERQELVKAKRLPKAFDGVRIRDWWVQGPFTIRGRGRRSPQPPPEKPGAPGQPGEGKTPELPPEPEWKYLAWREEFISLPEGPHETDTLGYRFFHRLVAKERMEVLLVCGSDVQLDLLVNGQTLSRIHASPQYRQPRHDDYRLGEWAESAIPVTLEKGENFIEAIAIQPPGSKGFFLEIADYKGKVPRGMIKLVGHGPETAVAPKKKPKPEILDAIPPVHNPSFEDGKGYARPWIMGPVEPRRAVKWDRPLDGVRGDRCLQLKLGAPAVGAAIQRVVFEPNSEWVLQGAMKTEDLRGKDAEAYICVFLQDPYGDGLARTEPLGMGSSKWRVVETKFFPRKRRIAYVGCVVKAEGGTVWFDEVRLVRKK